MASERRFAIWNAIMAANFNSASPTKANVCAIIVSYHPEGEFFLRLRRIAPQVASIVIVDNSAADSTAKLLRESNSAVPVNLISNEVNVGIATALNQGVRWATEHGYQWVLALDQDSIVAGDLVETVGRVFENYPEKEKLAVIGSNYLDKILAKPLLVFDDNDPRTWVEVKTTITSGSLIRLSAHRLIGPFREELFIDCVDFDYCLRARSRGFHVVMTHKPLMQHGIGNATRHSLPWKNTTTSNHSPIRRYYMTRNQIVVARDYFLAEPAWTVQMLYRHFKATLLMCLFEKDIWRKLRFTFLGLVDGFSANFQRVI
jgi:rhamnosyltransferase